MQSFPSIIGQLSGQSATYHVELTDNWLQGRAAFGGLIASLGAKAMSLHVPDDRPIRSLMTSFIAPAGAGKLSIDVAILRQGKSVQQLMATIRQGDQVIAVCNAAFAALRDTVGIDAPIATIEKQYDSVEPMPHFEGITPEFLRQFDVRWTGGGIPFSGSKDTRLQQWVRHLNQSDEQTMEQLIAIADVPPPLMLSHYNAVTTASSLTWMLDFIVPPDQIDNDWYYLEFDLTTAANGYSQQRGHVYSKTGKLLLIGNQCMTYFEPRTV